MIYEKLAWLGIDFIPTVITYILSFIALLICSITDWPSCSQGRLTTGVGCGSVWSTGFGFGFTAKKNFISSDQDPADIFLSCEPVRMIV